MQLHVAKNGQQTGPFDEAQIRDKLATGEFAPTDLAWHADLAGWQPLSTLIPTLPAAASAPAAAPASASTFAPAFAPVSSAPVNVSGPAMPPPGPASFGSSRPAAAGYPAVQNQMAPRAGSPNKQQYLDTIRAGTAYPTYRGIIGVMAIIGYILAGLGALFSLFAGLAGMRGSFLGGLGIILGGLIYSALIFLGARFWKEAATILADIGDSITETNSRNP